MILTGGIPTLEGLQCLYKQKSLETLVLDYEETDSDEEAIDLLCFPNLKYVLSRSNLNIKNYNQIEKVHIEILNHYQNGKMIVCKYPSNYKIFSQKKFLFFSTEAKYPASFMIMQILAPIEETFQKEYKDIIFSHELESISIIPICVPEDMINQGVGKERRMVSLKKHFADIRIRISYDEFVSGGMEKQVKLCKQNIIEAAQYIYKKDKTFEINTFLDFIDKVFMEKYKCN